MHKSTKVQAHNTFAPLHFCISVKNKIMIPIVRTYHRNPVNLKNMYNDEYCGGRMESHHQKVNIIENENDFQLDLIAPGYNKEEIKVTVEKDELTIASAEQEKAEDNKGQNFVRKEFSKRTFKRTFKLPENVETDKIAASHNNGILTITLPKKAKVEIPVQQIEVK